MVTTLEKIGFSGGDADPCLYVREELSGLCIVALYVVDNLLVGHPKAIDATIEELRKEGLAPTVEDEFNNYLSYMIKF